MYGGRYGQIDGDVVAITGEACIGLDLDLDKRVAGTSLAHPCSAFAFEAKRLPVEDPGRYRHIERAAARQRKPLRYSRDRIGKADRQSIEQILPPPVGAGLSIAPKKVGEDIVIAAEIGIAGVAGVASKVGSRIVTVELLGRALGPRFIDLARIIAPALVRITQQIIGAGNVLELVLGGLVTGIEIRMKLLRELAIGLLDFFRRCRGRDPQFFVRTAQPSCPPDDRKCRRAQAGPIASRSAIALPGINCINGPGFTK